MKIFLSNPGVVSAAGLTCNEFYESIINGTQSAFSKVKVLDDNEYFAARVDDSKLKETSCKYKIHFYRLLEQSLEQIAPAVNKAIKLYGSDRIGVCMGSCDNGSELGFPGIKKFIEEGEFDKEFHVRMLGNDYPAAFTKDKFSLSAPASCFATACSSSASAVIHGAQLIKSGICDAVICGGTDLATNTVLMGFSALSAVSSQLTNPFSKNRSGITIGEASAYFVLSKDDLDNTGITLLGYGESSDAYHLTTPDPEGDGAYTAMKNALDKAGLKPEEIEYINLHGTGTKFNDLMECKALKKLFNSSRPYLSSTKSVTGHTLGAAGALELAACFMSLKNGKMPLHVWDKEGDSETTGLNFVTKENSNKKISICMSNSYAFGGANTSLIIGQEK